MQTNVAFSWIHLSSINAFCIGRTHRARVSCVFSRCNECISAISARYTSALFREILALRAVPCRHQQQYWVSDKVWHDIIRISRYPCIIVSEGDLKQGRFTRIHEQCQVVKVVDAALRSHSIVH